MGAHATESGPGTKWANAGLQVNETRRCPVRLSTDRMVSRLIEPSRGQNLIDGENILKRDAVELRRHIGT
ncbi:hypothetical protein Adu01nite_71880 [Paractinoplanes durhamensis]|uniref:Uncharacterized protein n=1 Tax=Paractinoplanes durhamensis TaxID=113563 RepID=A0ABQ3Z7M6_9ACTN|nr:hypothetical protein Adu01nite_71880 [Actinoplanes durhamensis]